MIELKIALDDIDYNTLAELMMDSLKRHYDPSDDSIPIWGKLLLSSQGVTKSTVTAILSKLPQDKKDELAVRFINQNKYKIKEKLEQMAYNSGVNVKISGVEANAK